MLEYAQKPWGYERTYAVEPWLIKRLVLRAGQRTSVHKHKLRREHLIVLSGHGRMKFEDSEKPFDPDDMITIKVNQIHRIIAETEVDILVVGTPYPEDVVRVKDAYGRVKKRKK